MVPSIPFESSSLRFHRMLRKTWLLFSQAVTVALAMLFVVMTLKPEWLPHSSMGLSNTLPAPTYLPPVAMPACRRAISSATKATSAFQKTATACERQPVGDNNRCGARAWRNRLAR